MATFGNARGSTACVTKVELTISCQKLLNKDLTSKSDPICVVLLQDSASKKWDEVGRTEHLKNTLNPSFGKKVVLSYFFEEVQKICFKIYDIDNSTATLDDDDFLGESACTLGQVVSKKTYESNLVNHDKRPCGLSSITVLAEEVSDTRVVTMSLNAQKLDKKDFLGKSDPFLELWRSNIDGTWTIAHRTEVVKCSLNPHWKPFTVTLQALCAGDMQRQIKVLCYDWDGDGKHDLIGEFYVDLASLQDGPTPKEFACVNPKKKSKKSYKNSGVVFINSCKIEKHFSFLDFIFGGLQLNFTVGCCSASFTTNPLKLTDKQDLLHGAQLPIATENPVAPVDNHEMDPSQLCGEKNKQNAGVGIDFTGSNGDPRSPDSLHFMNPLRPNEYLQALCSVCSVLQDYDSDNLYPALGFGAKLPATGEVSHEFPLNFRPDNPYCEGVSGVVEAYKEAITRIQLWGPTNIAPIISHVARFAAQSQATDTRPCNYFVLLILTDGVITDMEQTREALVHASSLPMSVIIVGVGSADFGAMELLDGDDGVLRAPSGKAAVRDIVQFVPFRQFKKFGEEKCASSLAKAVLAEVPTQVTSYYRARSMPPGAR